MVKGHVEYEPGSGPRHFVFNADGVLYTLNELKSTISAASTPPRGAYTPPLHTTDLRKPAEPARRVPRRRAPPLLLRPEPTLPSKPETTMTRPYSVTGSRSSRSRIPRPPRSWATCAQACSTCVASWWAERAGASSCWAAG
ncbi:hypothetical protein FA95DRAFT_1296965 [Auriscalpium vulgare]|uniref:Uncharacterized protein n=1 Tax=Auriscalpium vulgare TaxID=40419 RepID=A0ACB8RSY3_9AGAM|nr:hypothetical protein FA95DRAFT_1296965 [Auriscalpium vulgare]